jgi:putative DNA primase/helicase
MHGREGCAVRLRPIQGDTLGIGEGIETSLAANSLHGISTWAALNTAMLAKFTPPTSVRNLVIFADADEPGLKAAARLTERLQKQLQIELRVPPAGFKDWNDVLMGAV